MPELKKERCAYRHLAHNVHEFVFLEANHQAVDEWASILETIQLAGNWYGQNTVRIILDTRQAGQLPIRYMFECLSDYNREYAYLKAPQLRMAILYNTESSIMLPIFTTFAEMMRSPVKTAFFTDADVDKSMLWLLSDD